MTLRLHHSTSMKNKQEVTGQQAVKNSWTEITSNHLVPNGNLCVKLLRWTDFMCQVAKVDRRYASSRSDGQTVCVKPRRWTDFMCQVAKVGRCMREVVKMDKPYVSSHEGGQTLCVKSLRWTYVMRLLVKMDRPYVSSHECRQTLCVKSLRWTYVMRLVVKMERPYVSSHECGQTLSTPSSAQRKKFFSKFRFCCRLDFNSTFFSAASFHGTSQELSMHLLYVYSNCSSRSS
jgi:hypothetical protein